MKDAPHLATLLDCARVCGWRRHHQRPAQTVGGFRSAITGDTGFPDLVLARNGVVLHFEIKGAGGYPSLAQLAWGAVLPCWWVVRPDALDEALAIITHGPLRASHDCSLTVIGPQPRWAGPLAKWAEKHHPMKDTP